MTKRIISYENYGPRIAIRTDGFRPNIYSSIELTEKIPRYVRRRSLDLSLPIPY